MVAMTFLETHRLIFRSHEAQDESAFVRMQTDPEVRRYVGGPPWPLEKALSRFRNDYLGQPTDVLVCGPRYANPRIPTSAAVDCVLPASQQRSIWLSISPGPFGGKALLPKSPGLSSTLLSNGFAYLASLPKSTTATRSLYTSSRNWRSTSSLKNGSLQAGGFFIPTNEAILLLLATICDVYHAPGLPVRIAIPPVIPFSRREKHAFAPSKGFVRPARGLPAECAPPSRSNAESLRPSHQ